LLLFPFALMTENLVIFTRLAVLRACKDDHKYDRICLFSTILLRVPLFVDNFQSFITYGS
jgi:hypothetical protein